MNIDFNDVTSKIDKIAKPQKISIEKLLTPPFIKSISSFKDCVDFFENGLNIKSKEEFENVDISLLNNLVAKCTKFDNWEDLLQEAGKEYYIKEINKIL